MLTAGNAFRWPLTLRLASLLPALTTLLSTTEVTVIEVRGPELSLVTVRAMVYSGSADDPPGKEGLACLTAQMIKREAAEQLEGLSARLEVAAGKDAIAFTLTASPENIGRSMEIFETTMIKPVLDAAKLEAQREEQRLALEAAMRDPARLAREAFDAFVFRGHPYAHAALGRLSSLGSLARDDVVAFHAAHWRKGNVAFGVAGDAAGDLAARLSRDFAALPDGEPARPPRPVSWLPHPRVVVVEEPAAAIAAVRAGHVLNVTRAHPDYLALKLANLLAADPGGAAASPEVSIELVDPGVADGAAPALPRRQEAIAMTWAAAAGEAPADARRSLSLRVELARSGPDGARIEQAKKSARSRGPFPAGDSLSELEARMEELLYRAPGFASRYEAGLDAVDAEMLRGAASRALFPDRTAIIAVVPDAKAFIEGMLAPSADASQQSRVPRLERDDFELLSPESLYR